jgi:site-specific DNA-cytosine methylase
MPEILRDETAHSCASDAMRQVPTVVDLFCGAGGLSLGFVQAGYEVVLAVDNNNVALKTYAANLGTHSINLDLSAEIDWPSPTDFVKQKITVTA